MGVGSEAVRGGNRAGLAFCGDTEGSLPVPLLTEKVRGGVGASRAELDPFVHAQDDGDALDGQRMVRQHSDLRGVMWGSLAFVR